MIKFTHMYRLTKVSNLKSFKFLKNIIEIKDLNSTLLRPDNFDIKLNFAYVYCLENMVNSLVFKIEKKASLLRMNII